MSIFSRLFGFSLFIAFLFPFLAFTQKNIDASTQSKIDELIKQATAAEASSNKPECAKNYNKIALLYWETNNYKEAIDYFNKSIEINQALDNNFALKEIYTYKGQIYNDLKNYDQALNSFQNSLKFSKTLNNNKDIASAYNNIALTLSNQKKYSESNIQLQEAVKIAKATYDTKILKSCYLMLYDNYKKLGDNEQAANYYELYATFEKKAIEDQSNSKLSEMEARTRAAEIEKLQKEKSLLEQFGKLQFAEKILDSTQKLTSEQKLQIEYLNKSKENNELKVKEQQARLEKERLYRYGFAVFIVLLLLFAIALYRNARLKQKANILLAEQNDEILVQRNNIEFKNKELENAFNQIQEQTIKITDSINYAQRIQQAMLPGEANVRRYLPDSFVFFKPREIVSGDFYWLYRLNECANKPNNSPSKRIIDEHGESFSSKENFNLILAVVDSTGHGVPGAFMSMIGYNLLNAILNKGVKEADKILNELHVNVRYALKQHKNDNRDGMDMALTVINKDEKTIEFAGAKNPLIYIQNNELFTINGDSNPIGGLQKEEKRIFTKHIIKYDKPTVFYMFSDGYHDQFGGKLGKKFMSANFKKFLLDIHQKPFEEQKELLQTNLTQWMGTEHYQTDDILVIGFKLS